MRTLPALLVVSLLAGPVVADAAQRLRDYPSFERALRQGRSVRAVIEYKKAELTIDGKVETAPDATGGMTFHSWEHFAKGVVRNEKAYVAASETHLIAHPRHGHVYNYVRLRIYEDGQVEITARYLKPTTFEVVMDETFRARISNGRDKHAVSLFAG